MFKSSFALPETAYQRSGAGEARQKVPVGSPKWESLLMAESFCDFLSPLFILVFMVIGMDCFWDF